MKATERKGWQKGFDAGYMCALATIMQQHGEDTIVRDALKENFVVKYPV